MVKNIESLLNDLIKDENIGNHEYIGISILRIYRGYIGYIGNV